MPASKKNVECIKLVCTISNPVISEAILKTNVNKTVK